MSNAERIRRCQPLAHGASLMAIASQRDVKREYLILAENRLQFAEAIGREPK
jgi:hypothetical protein